MNYILLCKCTHQEWRHHHFECAAIVKREGRRGGGGGCWFLSKERVKGGGCDRSAVGAA